ncbi:hypothetical protein C8R45DRAFT_1135642 [Mycena sanguinolenta]|nr:hypothetical protein C8R45DRAFT_1135642 [Mycena sanguinolenta]
MLEFGRECFSEAECRARAVGSGSLTTRHAGARGVSASAGGSSSSTREGTEVRDGDSDGHDGIGGAVAHVDGGAGGDDSSAGNEDGGAGGENGGTGGMDGGTGNGDVERLQGKIDVLWSRSDGKNWTKELKKAHVGLERGRTWGIKWAQCVAAFFDFEAAHGYSEVNVQTDTTSRPKLIAEWLTRGRDWDRWMVIGFVADWVPSWWAWWVSLQPKERVYADGELSRPDTVDWSTLAHLHGKNGLLMVMASLLWWGDHYADGMYPADRVDWLKAVEDVTWTLQELEKSGCIEKGKEKAGGKRKRGQGGAEDGAEGYDS